MIYLLLGITEREKLGIQKRKKSDKNNCGEHEILEHSSIDFLRPGV